jgi:azurin
MKNFKNFMAISIALIAILFITSYCTKTKEQSDCEKYNTGTIRVTSSVSFDIYVDVTTVQLGYNDVRILHAYQSTDYDMPAGIVYCYAASQTNYDNNKWNEKIESCTQCKNFTLTWTTGGKSYSVNDNNNVIYNENFNIAGNKAKQ